MTLTFSPRGRPRPAAGHALVLGLALALTLCCSARSHAQGLVLANLVVDNQEGAILIRFGVEVEGTSQIAELLRDGESLELHCSATLLRERSLWLDKTVSSTALELSLRHDPLSMLFVAETPGGGPPMTHPDLTALLGKAWAEISLNLGDWKDLSRGREYSLLLEIKLNRLDVPVWLKRSLFFWDWEATPATRYQLDFTY